ncbi:MAG TPA: hypothetical protein PKW90_24350, partial [Myxococcota bacterium]|nr:hypothetical protein [Myxococcota bacterium]
MDNLSTMAEVGVEFWIRVRQGNWEGNVHWLDKFQLGFTDRGLDWDVLTATGMRSLHVDLYGVGAADPYTLLGGDWHHVAAFYSSRTGDQRIYIDGVCPPGFFIHHPSGSPLNNGGVLNFTHSGATDHLVADLDEFAVYDTVLPPQLVWEHYQQGLAGQAINYTQQSPVATYPFPGPVEEGEVNLLEFPPAWPNVPLSPLELFNTYPHPRYSAIDSIRPLIPFVADAEPFRHGADIPRSHSEARLMLEHLAWDWNYYMYCGSTHGNYMYFHRGTTTTPDSNYYQFHILRSLNNPANNGLPRSLITYWNKISESFLHDGDTLSGYYRSPIILQQSGLPAWFNPPALADSFFVRDSSLATPLLPWGPPVRDGLPQPPGRFRLNWAMAA